MEKKNKQLSVVIFVILSVSIISSCSKKVVHQSVWHHEKNKKVAEKTPANKMLYDKRSGILYKISNDSSSLFFELKINDETIQKKILMFGLTAWIDTTGKTQKKLGVKYPVGMKEFRGQKNGIRQIMTGNFSSNKHELVTKFNQIEIIRKNKQNDIEVSDKRYKNDIKTNISFDELGFMYCYFQIPYKKLNISYSQIVAGNPSIGFETGHLDMQQMQNRQGGRRPGGGGKPGGSGRPGGKANFNSDMQALQQATSFWLKDVKIAKQ